MNLDLSPRRKRRLRWAAWLLGIYTVFGFLILPLIVKAVAISQLKKALDREVTIKSVRMNPYALSATVRGLLVNDKDGEPLLSWDEFHVNFELRSFFGKSWVFKEVRLVQPFARVQINKDSSMNFSDLVKDSGQEKPPSAEPGKPFLLRVKQLEVKGARVSFTDMTPSKPFRRIVGPLDVSLTHFHTDPASENPYSFSGTTDSGETFSWSGHFFLDPIHSEGELSIGGVSIPRFAPLFQDLVRFEIKDGVVDFRGKYRFGLGGSNYVASVSNAAFSLRSFKLANLDATDNLVELDSFSITNANVDAAARIADIGAFILDGGRLALKRDSNAAINIVEAGRPTDNATNAPGGILFLLHAATNAFAALINSTNLWSATLQEFVVTNSFVHWEDNSLGRPVRLPVDDISITARHISNLPGTNMTLDVAFRWNTNGTFRLDSSTLIQPASMDVTLALNQMELSPLGPYLDPFVNLYVLDSKLSLDGHIQMRTGGDGLPVVTFTGNTRLDDFATADGVMNQDLVKWKTFSFTDIDAALNPPSVAVKEIALIEPFVLLAVQTNHALNTVNILRAVDTNAPPTETRAAAETTSSPAESNVGIGRKLGRLLRQSLTASTNEDGSPLAPKISVDAFVLSNATFRYADYSVSPHVRAGFQSVNARVSAISSSGLQPSEVQLSGKSGTAGSFDLTGHINPLKTNSATDLKLVIKDVDLVALSPYSAKYLGWRLNRGALNLDVDYLVSERKFTAKNILMLDQFTFGQRVNSPDATHLPVRLAVGVLKDSEGKIVLDIPIDGNLDDPQLRFGKVISRAIVNIIVKIATSPFVLLGSVFGGKGVEVSYVDFAAGSADLIPANFPKLDLLLNGLSEKPGLNLAIEGSYNPVADTDGLKQRRLAFEFQQKKWASLRKSVQETLKPADVIVSVDERAAFIQEAYKELLASNQTSSAQGSSLQEAAPAPRPTSPAKAAESVMRTFNPPPPAPVPDMEIAVLQTIQISEADLQELATNRAQRVFQKLVDSGRIDAARLSIAMPEDITPGEPASRVYFHLQ